MKGIRPHMITIIGTGHVFNLAEPDDDRSSDRSC